MCNRVILCRRWHPSFHMVADVVNIHKDDIRIGDVFRRADGEEYTVGYVRKHTITWTNGTERDKCDVLTGREGLPYVYTLIGRKDKSLWVDDFGFTHKEASDERV